MEFAFEEYQKAAQAIADRLPGKADTAIVLGSGLGRIAEQDALCEIPYGEIPGFGVSTVESHAGKLVLKRLGGREVLFLSGRFHYYEGYSFAQTAFYVRVLQLLGVRTLILTNAAGGINQAFSVGDLMLITDHIKFFDDSPVRGRNLDAFGKRFFDMTTAYSPALCALARQKAGELGIVLREGVYAYMPGPQFETPAEIRALRVLGADAVGMSTVPEVITAAQCGLQVLGISCITNLAAGMTDGEIDDGEVTQAADMAYGRFSTLLTKIVEGLDRA